MRPSSSFLRVRRGRRDLGPRAAVVVESRPPEAIAWWRSPGRASAPLRDRDAYLNNSIYQDFRGFSEAPERVSRHAFRARSRASAGSPLGSFRDGFARPAGVASSGGRARLIGGPVHTLTSATRELPAASLTRARMSSPRYPISVAHAGESARTRSTPRLSD